MQPPVEMLSPPCDLMLSHASIRYARGWRDFYALHPTIMDPVSAFGVVSGGVQVVQAIASTIHGLNQLYGKFKDADLTIQSLIQELSCINTALTSLKEWTRLNSNNGLQSEEYSRDLAVAMEGCRVIMEVVSHDVSTLVQSSRDDGFAGFHTRIRVVWKEDTMRGHQEKLHSQVMALQLLLQVCQW